MLAFLRPGRKGTDAAWVMPTSAAEVGWGKPAQQLSLGPARPSTLEGDLERFEKSIEARDQGTGAWRGEIHPSQHR